MSSRSWLPALLLGVAFAGFAGGAAAQPRVVLIGVDGATWNVIDPLVEAGEMPNLAALMARGVHAEMSTVEPVNSPTVWTTIATGQPPETTGIASFIVDERDLRVPRVFEWLTHQGLRVGLYQYLVTWPPRPLPGGFVIPGWLSGGPETAPARLADHYRYDIDGIRTPQGFSEVAFEELAKKPAAFNALVEAFELDAAAVSFYAIDALSHRFWANSFPEDFDADVVAGLDPAFANTLQRAYRELDRALGEVIAALPEDTAVILVSDHGFEALGAPQRRWSFFLEERLTRAVPPGADYEVSSEFAFPIIRVFPGPFAEREAALAEIEAFYDGITTPSGEALFWTQPLDVAERPPEAERGFVESAKQLALRALGRFMGTTLDENAHGFLVALPLGGWEEVWPDGRVRIGSETVAAREIVYGDGFTGQHLETAVFVAAGPAIAASPDRGSVSVLDVAPLYAWLARAAVPEGLTGELPARFLDPDALAERPLATVPADRWPRLPVSLPEAEDADLIDRLKAMGYAN